ncbi:MAG: hypothetical protein EZS28_025234 [Streblomastix strix]|uniref:Uncharacterized protein n=1 Tax=Streblomastix strix TaxID=222440 RepID=A0A5J4V9V5_9EUKA|nr:MAG: hypothetical protein EZS28_025234 [Streblomastix strix]
MKNSEVKFVNPSMRPHKASNTRSRVASSCSGLFSCSFANKYQRCLQQLEPDGGSETIEPLPINKGRLKFNGENIKEVLKAKGAILNIQVLIPGCDLCASK